LDSVGRVGLISGTADGGQVDCVAREGDAGEYRDCDLRFYDGGAELVEPVFVNRLHVAAGVTVSLFSTVNYPNPIVRVNHLVVDGTLAIKSASLDGGLAYIQAQRIEIRRSDGGAGRIDLSGQGFEGQRAPYVYAERVTSAFGRCGGFHGGTGGIPINNCQGGSQFLFDSWREPAVPGFGGGCGTECVDAGIAAWKVGSGGGALRVSADTLILGGAIDVAGAAPPIASSGGAAAAGGGAGGALDVRAWTLVLEDFGANATLCAAPGGEVHRRGFCAEGATIGWISGADAGGGGGGGRIAIRAYGAYAVTDGGAPAAILSRDAIVDVARANGGTAPVKPDGYFPHGNPGTAFIEAACRSTLSIDNRGITRAVGEADGWVGIGTGSGATLVSSPTGDLTMTRCWDDDSGVPRFAEQNGTYSAGVGERVLIVSRQLLVDAGVTIGGRTFWTATVAGYSGSEEAACRRVAKLTNIAGVAPNQADTSVDYYGLVDADEFVIRGGALLRLFAVVSKGWDGGVSSEYVLGSAPIERFTISGTLTEVTFDSEAWVRAGNVSLDDGGIIFVATAYNWNIRPAPALQVLADDTILVSGNSGQSESIKASGAGFLAGFSIDAKDAGCGHGASHCGAGGGSGGIPYCPDETFFSDVEDPMRAVRFLGVGAGAINGCGASENVSGNGGGRVWLRGGKVVVGGKVVADGEVAGAETGGGAAGGTIVVCGNTVQGAGGTLSVNGGFGAFGGGGGLCVVGGAVNGGPIACSVTGGMGDDGGPGGGNGLSKLGNVADVVCMRSFSGVYRACLDDGGTKCF
jgi:hypothetical protein